MSFRAPKRRNVKSARFIRDSDSEDEAQAISMDPKNPAQLNITVEEAVDAVKTWQNIRKRKAGISAESLYVGKKLETEVLIEEDPFKMKTGGLVEMKGAFRKPLKDELDEEVRLSKNFTAETNKRDEDADMLKYIETELAKRKGITTTEVEAPKTILENILSELPATLISGVAGANGVGGDGRSEEMLSHQMLCGIPEVDLGVEAKMRNIEATEEAKQRLLRQRIALKRRREAEDDDLAPYNMSVNFVQHSRWNNYVDPTLHRELTVQLNENTDHPDVPEIPSIVDNSAIEEERRRLEAEKSSDAKVLQRYKNFMQNKRGR